MVKIKISGVRAEPGGLRDLMFSESGYTPTRPTYPPTNLARVLDQVFGPWPFWIALTALLASMPALYLLEKLAPLSTGSMEPLLLYAAGIALLFILGSGIYHAWGDITEIVSLAGRLALLTVTLPLLLSRRYRAWASDLFNSEHPRVPAARIADVRSERRGGEVTVTVRLTDGATVRYTAQGKAGQQLRLCFSRMRAAGVPE